MVPKSAICNYLKLRAMFTAKCVEEVELRKDGKGGPRFVFQLKPIGDVVTVEGQLDFSYDG